MAVWPAALPQSPEIDGYQEEAPNTALRTQMDVGPPKQRRRYTAGSRPFAMRFLLTKAQVAILETFYVTTLVGGTLSFDWTHPRTAAASVFRFVSNPKYAALGPDAWRVECQMEILP